jgi:undecaprenyl-diphosphatase
MTILQAVILGIVQGLTEFLPVSSSAHLVLVPYLAGWNLDQGFAFVFDVLVQLGTLAAVIFYFRKDLVDILKAWLQGIRQHQPFANENSRMGWNLIFATIPAGLAGLLLKDKVEAAFASPVLTAVFLFCTAILLVGAEIYHRQVKSTGQEKSLARMTTADAVVVGLFQALSIFPGISRSGATISGGIFRKIDRQGAARFAFLMSIPIMLAAAILGVKDLLDVPNLGQMAALVAVGFILAGVMGYLVIRWFISYLRGKSLLPFAAYCAVLALIVVVISYFRG